MESWVSEGRRRAWLRIGERTMKRASRASGTSVAEERPIRDRNLQMASPKRQHPTRAAHAPMRRGSIDAAATVSDAVDDSPAKLPDIKSPGTTETCVPEAATIASGVDGAAPA